MPKGESLVDLCYPNDLAVVDDYITADEEKEFLDVISNSERSKLFIQFTVWP